MIIVEYPTKEKIEINGVMILTREELDRNAKAAEGKSVEQKINIIVNKLFDPDVNIEMLGYWLITLDEPGAPISNSNETERITHKYLVEISKSEPNQKHFTTRAYSQFPDLIDNIIPC